MYKNDITQWYKYYTKKDCEKKHVKDIKIFLKKKNIKGKKRSETDTKIFLKNRSRNY